MAPGCVSTLAALGRILTGGRPGGTPRRPSVRTVRWSAPTILSAVHVPCAQFSLFERDGHMGTFSRRRRRSWTPGSCTCPPAKPCPCTCAWVARGYLESSRRCTTRHTLRIPGTNPQSQGRASELLASRKTSSRDSKQGSCIGAENPGNSAKSVRPRARSGRCDKSACSRPSHFIHAQASAV